VDRTPFHTLYIQAHIDGYVDDVLLLKQFAKAGGVLWIRPHDRGVLRDLCEILVIYYGGFHPLLEAAAYWRPGEVIDIEEHGTKQFEDPLVVIDPVDPERNVAAALSLSRMFEFVELAVATSRSRRRRSSAPHPPRCSPGRSLPPACGAGDASLLHHLRDA